MSPDTALDGICYKNNFLSAVVFRIDFSPILKINESVAEFQEMIRSDFPILDKTKTLTLRAQFQKGETSQGIAEFPEWIFSNKDKTLQLNLANEHLSLQTNKYERFEVFKKATERIIGFFTSQYAPVQITRCGLRYINEIVFKEGNPLEWGDFIADSLLHIVNSFPTMKSQIARTIGQTIFNRKDHVLTFTYGLYNKSEYPNPVSRKEFVLDYDCSTVQIESSEILSQLDIYHNDIQSLFENSIKDTLRTTMGITK